METILQGWLIKSPPEKAFGTWKLFGPQWRRRWFVLYAPPTVEGIPNVYTAILEYYSNRKLNKKCGSINLAECGEVMSALDSDIYRWVFGIQTVDKHRLSRMYYLVTETETEMNKWVNTLIRVLGLAESDDQLTITPPSFVQAAPPAPPPGRTVTARQSTRRPRPNFSTHPTAKPHSPDDLDRPATGLDAAPFSRLHVSEPNLLDFAIVDANSSHGAVNSKGTRGSAPTDLDHAGGLSAGNDHWSDALPPGVESREFMRLPPLPVGCGVGGVADLGCPPGVKGHLGARAGVEGVRGTSTYDQPKQGYFPVTNGHGQASSRDRASTVNIIEKNATSLRVKSGVDCYDVPPNAVIGSDCYDRPQLSQNSPQQRAPASRGSPARAESSNDCYNVPAKHGGDNESIILNDSRQSSSAGGEVYNVPTKKMDIGSKVGVIGKKQQQASGADVYNAPQKHKELSSRQSISAKQQTTSSDGEVYNVPSKKGGPVSRRSILVKQQGSSADREVYNVPQKQSSELPCQSLSDFSAERELYNVPQKHGDASNASKQPREIVKSLEGENRDVYNVPTSQYIPSDVKHKGEDIEEGRCNSLSPGNCLISGIIRNEGNRCHNDLYDTPQMHPTSKQHEVNVTSQSASSEFGLGHEHRANTKPTPAPKPTRIPAKITASSGKGNSPAGGEDAGLGSGGAWNSSAGGEEEELQGRGPRVRMDGEGGRETSVGEKSRRVLDAKPSLTYRQNEGGGLTSSPSYLARKQGGATVALQDSIRFTQRSRSFKRSLSSMQRSAPVNLPTKRITERHNDTSSSSDDIDDE